MTTAELTKAIILKLAKNKLIILIGGIALGALLFFFAYRSKPSYTSRATVFPLSNQSENALSGGSLSSLLGMAEASKSFSNEASINIIELALSRNVRESAASERVKNLDNKTVAQLLIEENNKNKSLFASEIKIPTDSVQLITKGGSILKDALEAKINKNGVLELLFTNTNQDLVKPVTEVVIDKISQFYINLRIQKALADYTFTESKIDSLEYIVKGYDRRAVAMENSTLFTPDRLQYSLPKENLSDDRERYKAQRNAAIANRDEALWRLQKATPIIATLDKPDPPYAVEKKSPVIFGTAGFFIGILITAILVISGLIYRFAKNQINQSLGL
ncbi:MAG: hypothetical protein V4556_14630 [Bacteroidota bacterium]